MSNEEKPTSTSNAFAEFLDSMKGQTILKGVSIGLLALCLAVSTSALVVTLTTINKSNPLTHVVSFRNYDNSLVTSETINDGELASDPGIIPTEPSSSSSTYTFTGWNTDFSESITSDITYKAQYQVTPIQVTNPEVTYEVRFLNDDAAKSVLYSCSVKSGEKASYQGVTPTKATDANYSYTFTDWDKSTDTTITTNTDFTAQYNKVAIVVPATTYAVRFLDDDGSLLHEENVVSGNVAEYKWAKPAKTSSDATYKFVSWDKDITAKITANTDFTAKYDTYYEVNFLNYDGSLFYSEEVKKGELAKINITPTKKDDQYTSFTFNHWMDYGTYLTIDEDYINENTTFDAIFSQANVTTNGVVLTPDNESSPTYYTVTGYTGTNPYVYISATYNNLPISHISKSAFKWKSIVTHISGSGITTIDDGDSSTGAFMYCDNLEAVTFDSLKTVGDYAFYDDSALTSFNSSTVTSIGSYSFASCLGLKSVACMTATTVGEYAFFDCDSLLTPMLNYVTSLGKSAFSDCDSLQSIVLSSLTTINDDTFYYCNSLDSISINNVVTIGKEAFELCQNLIEIYSESVKTVGEQAFSGCYGLTSVSFSTATTIGEGAFCNCYHLSALTIPLATSLDDSAFSGCYSVGHLVINDASLATAIIEESTAKCNYYTNSTTSITIPDNAFKDLTNLSKYESTNGATISKIGESAFANTAITSLPALGQTCSIGCEAFSKCSHLSTLDFTSVSTSLTLDSYCFAGIGNISFLYLPQTITFTGAEPFYGDTFYEGHIIYSGTKTEFGKIVDSFNTSFPNNTLFETGTTIACSNSEEYKF